MRRTSCAGPPMGRVRKRKLVTKGSNVSLSLENANGSRSTLNAVE